jgi:hypothetical protein
MQYMLMIYDDEKAFAGLTEAQRAGAMEQYAEFTQSIVKSGNFRAAGQLQPTLTTTTLRTKEGKRVTTDGPFVETKEQLGGYYLIECKDLDEALAIARRIPEGGPEQTIEVRPLVPVAAAGKTAPAP